MILKKIFFISIIILFSYKVSAKEKEQIIQEMYNLKTLEFTFDQLINDKREKGNCILEFPGKLKCEYFDNKQKELVINNKRLAISQKRYNKTYYYPISNSPFLNILYKDKLLDIINNGIFKVDGQNLKLIYFGEDKIIIFFDKKNLQLKGWQILDQYNNNINFSLNVISKNDIYEKGTFKIPKID